MALAWVAGGMYDVARGSEPERREFRLVRPSGAESRPYVRLTEKAADELYNLTRHHSHLYSFDPAHPATLTLARESWEAAGSKHRIGVDAPATFTLTGQLLADLCAAVAAESAR
jgi:hypothetical protein